MTNKTIYNCLTIIKLQWHKKQSNNYVQNKQEYSKKSEDSQRQNLLILLLRQLREAITKHFRRHVMPISHTVEVHEQRSQRSKQSISLRKKLGLSLLYLNFLDDKPDYCYFMLKDLWRNG